MGERALSTLLVGSLCLLQACAPCSPDTLEPNDSEDQAATGEEADRNNNELDLDFHDPSDVDCIRYDIPDPGNFETPELYVDVIGGDREEIEVTVTFGCNSGEQPTDFSCNGELAEELECTSIGREPNVSVSYDCDDTSEDNLGDSAVIVCLTRTTPRNECVDYSLRVFLN